MTTLIRPVVESYTQSDINRAIWDRVGGPTDRGLREAIEVLHEELLQTGDCHELWRVFGCRVLLDIENAERSGRDLWGVASDKSVEPGASWRERYKDGTASWRDLTWPVATTAIRKPLGEWTADDLNMTAKWYATVGKTLISKGSLFAKAAKEVGTETLGEAKLSTETREFFESMMLPRGRNSESESAAATWDVGKTPDIP